jgi:hypothetical protein
MTIEAEPGETILLCLALNDGTAGLFPRAIIRNPNGTTFATVDIDGDNGDGSYQQPFTISGAASEEDRSVVYRAYADAGRTVPSDFDLGHELLRVTRSEFVELELLRYDGAVHIDTSSAYTGTAFPVGTEEQPVNNLADALAIANARDIRSFHLRGLLTLTSALPDWKFFGDGEEAVIKLNGQDVSDSEFFNMRVEGTLGSGPISLLGCNIQDIDDFEGTATECGIESGELTFVGNGSFIRCHSAVPGTSTPVFNMNGSGYNLEFRAYAGGLELRGFVDAGDKVSVDMIAGQIILDASNTAGTAALRGVGKLTDNSGAGFIVDRYALLPNEDIVSTLLVEAIVDGVWDENINDHMTDESAGEAMVHAGAVHTRSTYDGFQSFSGTKRITDGTTTYHRTDGDAETGANPLSTKEMDSTHVDVQQWNTQVLRRTS